jgi:hypothetical protein
MDMGRCFRLTGGSPKYWFGPGKDLVFGICPRGRSDGNTFTDSKLRRMCQSKESLRLFFLEACHMAETAMPRQEPRVTTDH